MSTMDWLEVENCGGPGSGKPGPCPGTGGGPGSRGGQVKPVGSVRRPAVAVKRPVVPAVRRPLTALDKAQAKIEGIKNAMKTAEGYKLAKLHQDLSSAHKDAARLSSKQGDHSGELYHRIRQQEHAQESTRVRHEARAANPGLIGRLLKPLLGNRREHVTEEERDEMAANSNRMTSYWEEVENCGGPGGTRGPCPGSGKGGAAKGGPGKGKTAMGKTAMEKNKADAAKATRTASSATAKAHSLKNLGGGLKAADDHDTAAYRHDQAAAAHEKAAGTSRSQADKDFHRGEAQSHRERANSHRDTAEEHRAELYPHGHGRADEDIQLHNQSGWMEFNCGGEGGTPGPCATGKSPDSEKGSLKAGVKSFAKGGAQRIAGAGLKAAGAGVKAFAGKLAQVSAHLIGAARNAIEGPRRTSVFESQAQSHSWQGQGVGSQFKDIHNRSFLTNEPSNETKDLFGHAASHWAESLPEEDHDWGIALCAAAADAHPHDLGMAMKAAKDAYKSKKQPAAPTGNHFSARSMLNVVANRDWSPVEVASGNYPFDVSPYGGRWYAANAFCATGPGGGVDPSCGKEGGGGGGGSGGQSRAGLKGGSKDFGQIGKEHTSVTEAEGGAAGATHQERGGRQEGAFGTITREGTAAAGQAGTRQTSADLSKMGLDGAAIGKAGAILSRLSTAGKAMYDRQTEGTQKALNVALKVEHAAEGFYHKNQLLATEMAKANGMDHDKAELVGKALAWTDFAARWGSNIPLVHGLLHSGLHAAVHAAFSSAGERAAPSVVGGLAKSAVESYGGVAAFGGAKGGYYVPLASMAYTASQMVHSAFQGKNPLTTLKEARAKVDKIASHEHHEQERKQQLYGHGTRAFKGDQGPAYDTREAEKELVAHAASGDKKKAVLEMLKWINAFPAERNDEAMAVLAASIDKVQGDLQRAVKLAKASLPAPLVKNISTRGWRDIGA